MIIYCKLIFLLYFLEYYTNQAMKKRKKIDFSFNIAFIK